MVLLVLTGIRRWPRKHLSGALPPEPGGTGFSERVSPDPGGFPQPDPAMRERMEATLQKMPAEQRQTFAARMQADRAFFETLRGLPEEERRAKMEEYFAQNPPPPGFDPGAFPPAGGSGPGGVPGDGAPMHLPPPAIRHAMDQQIANSQGGN